MAGSNEWKPTPPPPPKDHGERFQRSSLNQYPNKTHIFAPIMMQPSYLDEECEQQEMNIELQATDSSGSQEFTETPDHDTEEGPHIVVIKAPTRTQAIYPPRRRFSWRKFFAMAIGVVPVAVFGFEMAPGRCHVCREDLTMDFYFITAAICGGLGAVLYGKSLDYWVARFVGGAIGALGSLFTVWMLLTSIPSKWAFLFVFVGLFGALPGFLGYFVVKILTDECYVSDVDDFDEIAPLTKIRIIQR